MEQEDWTFMSRQQSLLMVTECSPTSNESSTGLLGFHYKVHPFTNMLHIHGTTIHYKKEN